MIWACLFVRDQKAKLSDLTGIQGWRSIHYLTERSGLEIGERQIDLSPGVFGRGELDPVRTCHKGDVGLQRQRILVSVTADTDDQPISAG